MISRRESKKVKTFWSRICSITDHSYNKSSRSRINKHISTSKGIIRNMQFPQNIMIGLFYKDHYCGTDLSTKKKLEHKEVPEHVKEVVHKYSYDTEPIIVPQETKGSIVQEPEELSTSVPIKKEKLNIKPVEVKVPKQTPVIEEIVTKAEHECKDRDLQDFLDFLDEEE